MADLSLADIKAAMGDGEGNGLIWLLAIIMLMGGGNWGNRYEPQYATQDFVQNGFNFNDLQDQNRDILGAITSGTAQGVAATNQTFHDLLNALSDKYGELARDIAGLAVGQQQMQAKEAECCCSVLRAIDGVNYNGALNTASINANTTAVGQKILDAIQGNRMNDMQNRINQLELAQAMAGVVRYPNGFMYNAGPSPFCGGGCNCAA